MSFSGKVVLVTGASSGIGAATAVLFAEEGASVALVGRNETKLANVARQCAQYGTKPLIIRADVANEKEASTIVQNTVEHFGKLDVLVNNAGIVKTAGVYESNVLQIFDEVMNTNLRPVVQLTSLAAPHLMATKGNIVNVSSLASLVVGGEKSMAYCVSKAGLDHFTHCAALDFSTFWVRVNSVNPGPVRTDIFENCGIAPIGGGDAAWEQTKQLTVLKKVSEPKEIADLIAFLASDKARSITGSVHVCDNGMKLLPSSDISKTLLSRN